VNDFNEGWRKSSPVDRLGKTRADWQNKAIGGKLNDFNEG
jgi:hypothetical protein